MTGTPKSRRQGSLTDIGDGRWLVRLSLGSEGPKRARLSKVIRGKKEDAQRYLNAAIRRREQNQAVVLSRQPLGLWVEEWLTTWCNTMAPRTRADYAALLKRYLTPELRARKLVSLTTTDVQNFVNDLIATGLAPRTVTMAHGAIRTCLNKAVALGKIPRNVALEADLPRKTHTERLVFGPDEARRFREAIRGDRWEALFVLLLYTGIRPGEALGLQWSDVEGGFLRIRRALVRVAGQAPVLSSTKTGRSRVIPFGDVIVEALHQHRRAQLEWRLKLGGAYRDQGLIFANEEGGFADCHNITGRHFKPILKGVGLPMLRLYDLRHSCATLLLADGVHPKVVQERLGHSSITLTLDVYSHVVPGMQERASERLDELLRSEMQQLGAGSKR